MTVKQKMFVKKYIENKGNGTQAALDAYDVKNYNTAHVIASENLQKPTIKKAIEYALERAGLSDESISEMLRDATIAGIGVRATNADSLRGIDMLLKLKGVYPTAAQRTEHLRIERREHMVKMSFGELKTELEKLNRTTHKLIESISS